MNIGIAVRLIFASILLALGACGGGGDDSDDGGAQAPPTGIGPAGGTVMGPNGAQVVIPAGALATNTNIQVALSSGTVPALPAGLTSSGQMFAFTPHGTTFAVPVSVTLPFDPASVPAGSALAFYKTNAQNEWDLITEATFSADSVTAQVTSFSDGQVVIKPLVPNEPVRKWQFRTFPGDDGPETILPEPDGNGTAPVGVLLEKVVPFGASAFDARIFLPSGAVLPEDGVANGMVMSTADGVTYGVFADAPSGNLGTTEPIDGVTSFTQTQSFIKQASNAKLKFTVTAVLIDVRDFSVGRLQEGLRLQGETTLSIKAYKTPDSPAFFHAAARASVRKVDGTFLPRAEDDSNAKNHLWSLGDNFNFRSEDIEFNSGCFGRRHTLQLKIPLTYFVDLSSVELLEEFTVETRALAASTNRQGPAAPTDCLASSVSTWLRDPLGIGGTTVTFEGLEPTNNPLPPPPDQVLIEPAACVPGPGPDPASGVLQFDAASYTVDELAGAVPTITVTRTGGSSGAVTATFATSDGTAIGGTDYTPLNATVFFDDGEEGQRVVTVPILVDRAFELDETVNLTLSQPGGCAALGTQTTAVLAIRDNDTALPPPPGSSGALDSSFGSDGKATTTAFGGDRSAMAVQADGKVVIVGGTFVDFVLARFDADGTLDESFGPGGQITTDMVSGEQEEALGVAIQDDGKIVVAGYTGQPGGGATVFALARYLDNGSLDPTFGSGGRVISDVEGEGFAIAIQPDDRIVVSGRVDSDMQVARFDTDGSLDETFGVNGQLETPIDLFGDTDAAANLLLLSDGAIVVSGNSSVGGGSDSTGLARFTANGSLDSTFGVEGIVALTGQRVGEGLALQSDGKLVLVGSIETAVAPATSTQFALMRLDADGSVDEDFGTDGTVTTAISDLGDAARAVTLQDDGKILVAGSSSNQVNANFALARYNTDGTLDTAFANLGTLAIDFFGFTDIAESVAVQPDGKIVLGGLARDSVDGYGVARVVP